MEEREDVFDKSEAVQAMPKVTCRLDVPAKYFVSVQLHDQGLMEPDLTLPRPLGTCTAVSRIWLVSGLRKHPDV